MVFESLQRDMTRVGPGTYETTSYPASYAGQGAAVGPYPPSPASLRQKLTASFSPAAGLPKRLVQSARVTGPQGKSQTGKDESAEIGADRTAHATTQGMPESRREDLSNSARTHSKQKANGIGQAVYAPRSTSRWGGWDGKAGGPAVWNTDFGDARARKLGPSTLPGPADYDQVCASHGYCVLLEVDQANFTFGFGLCPKSQFEVTRPSVRAAVILPAKGGAKALERMQKEEMIQRIERQIAKKEDRIDDLRAQVTLATMHKSKRDGFIDGNRPFSFGQSYFHTLVCCVRAKAKMVHC